MKNQKNRRLFEVVGKNIGVPIFFSGIVTFAMNKGSEFLTSVESANWLEDILSKFPKAIIFLIVAIVIQRLLFYKKNNNEEFAPSNYYCEFSPIFYKLAFLLGYKRKIDLKLKPIDIQFQLFQLGNVELYDSATADLEESKNYTYTVERINELNSGNREINVIVADTYDVGIDKIPKILQSNYTIVINRKSKGTRVDGKKIVQILSKEIEALKDNYKVYNLFLSTPGDTNLRIYNSVFHTVNDDFIIKIYTQDKDCNFAFRNKPIKIKC